MSDANTLKIVHDHPLDRDYVGANPAQNIGYFDRQAFEAVRMRVDRAAQANRVILDVPQAGETPATYERRVVKSLMPHGQTYQPMGLAKIPEPLFKDIQQTVLTEAIDAPKRRGELVPINFKDEAGRRVTEFEGSMGAWMGAFKGVSQVGPIVIDGRPRRIPTIPT